MLYVVLLIAIAFYGALYVLWDVMQPHLTRPAATLVSVRELVFQVPEANALLLLKIVILLAALYVAADFLVACVRQLMRRRNRAIFIASSHSLPAAAAPSPMEPGAAGQRSGAPS